MLEELINLLKKLITPLGPYDRLQVIHTIQEKLHELSPMKHHPVSFVQWVPIDKVEPNRYNPNSVAGREMSLLRASILADGYTQPVVVVQDNDLYVIVDGFHRAEVLRQDKQISKGTWGYLPVVQLDAELGDRMASTIRHNRARGKHSIEGMSNLIFQMLEEGRTDSDICNELGMEPEELLRLKHVTGFSKLFEDVEYKKAWETKTQLMLRKKYNDSLGRQL